MPLESEEGVIPLDKGAGDALVGSGPEESLSDIEPIGFGETGLVTQTQARVIGDFIKPPSSRVTVTQTKAVFWLLMVEVDDETHRRLMEEALTAVATARAAGDLTQQAANRRINAILDVDGSQDSNTGELNYGVTKEILDRLAGSEDPEEVARAKAIVGAMSVSLKVERLERFNLDWCSPDEMAGYISAAVGDALNDLRSRRRARENRLQAYEHGIDDFRFLLATALERDMEEDGFLEAVAGDFQERMARAGKEVAESAVFGVLERLLEGNDQLVESFLQRTGWINLCL